ncbi:MULTISPECIES: hypothetical protein [Musicola]|uniref:Carrier domain-containing protein n=1 Tax=Musicola paradisiaca (strain Ech703) TaxID=579405 RepID=C6C6L4_MUSP7|nr:MULTISPECIES: hypothetical protein [Musicola]ACS83933.1 hypothetical protein Dd703_0114 [Musicola paradisiaca Ech703]
MAHPALVNHEAENIHNLLREKMAVIGIDHHRINDIFQGSPLFGDDGLFDSINLVSLIAVLSDHFETQGLSGELFNLMDDGVFDTFRDLSSLTRYLQEQTRHA